MNFKLITTFVFFAGTTVAALANGTHAGGHGEKLAVGEPGDKSKISRILFVTMKDDENGMRFTPKEISVKQGETIKFMIKNEGTVDHEFVLDDEPKMMAHKVLMEKFPEMEHDDPNMIRLASGKSSEVIWKFTNAGSFKFGCLIPGHMESGMVGPVVVK